MACFLVPAATATVTTVVCKQRKKDPKGQGHTRDQRETVTPFTGKLGSLCALLWAVSAVSMFEHILHGEVVPYFPFLTAAQTPEGLQTMLFEMATEGVLMTALAVAAWACLVMLSWNFKQRRHDAA